MNTVSDERIATAYHEAGHAVAKWLEGLPATAVHVGEGDGLVEAAGVEINHISQARISLSGPIAEAAKLLAEQEEIVLVSADRETVENMATAICLTFNWKICRSEDLLRVRSVLESDPSTRVVVGSDQQPRVAAVDEALLEWVGTTAEYLLPYFSLIERIAQAAVCGYLSATEVQSITMQWEQSHPGS